MKSAVLVAFVAATTGDGGLKVTARVPMEPEAATALIGWRVEAQRDCEADATHYALLIDESNRCKTNGSSRRNAGHTSSPRARCDLARSLSPSRIIPP